MGQSQQIEKHFLWLFVLPLFFISSLISTQAFAWTHFHSASYDRSHVETAVSQPVVALDSFRLKGVANRFQVSLEPVYAVSLDQSNGENVELVGVRGSEVWRARPEGRFIVVQKLGSSVERSDRRVREAEMSVMGARAIAAWEDFETQQLVAVLSANNVVYTVNRLPNRSLAVVRVGVVEE